MKVIRWSWLFFLAVSTTATAQTARQYFNELLSKNAFDHYSDEYVCFPDAKADEGQFAVIAKTKDIEEMMAANRQAGAKPQPPLGNHLVVRTYYKGVANGAELYDKVNKDSDEEWSLEYKSPMHGKNVYFINWTTGRYRFLVYALDVRKAVPKAEVDGRCELIHPRAPTPSS